MQTNTIFPLSSDALSSQEIAPAIRRGTLRLLHALGYAAVAELPLGSGRRADLVALGAGAEIWIVEIKSCVADFRADRKWQEYRQHCDRLLFAVAPEFPAAMLPEDAGLVIADAHGGALVREAPLHAIPPARRKAMLVRFGRAAAVRLAQTHDPGLNEPAEF
ncbi:MAG: MmcB family DNA repair protein [Bradyrhizobiaceae bacterium]|nr:MmcB family DNA repair protein [Bradyrhizobiaceae bacterium]